MLSVIILNVIMLNVIILSVVAPSPLLANIRLGCNLLTLTNTLAYHKAMLKIFVVMTLKASINGFFASTSLNLKTLKHFKPDVRLTFIWALHHWQVI